MNKKTRVKADPIVDEYDDNTDEIEKMKEQLFKYNEYSVYAINKFVLSQLGNNNQIHAKDITVNEFKDILFLFLIELYSANLNVDYKVYHLEENYRVLGYKMKDYIIERKVN